MQIRSGSHTMAFLSAEMGQPRDSSALLGDMLALRARMAEDGYLLQRDPIALNKVLQARQTILTHMHASTTNLTNRFRLSYYVRCQPAAKIRQPA